MRISKSIHAYVYVNVYVYVYVSVYVYGYVYVYVHAHVHVHVYVYVFVYVYVYVDVYAYTVYNVLYMYIYIHTYAYIHMSHVSISKCISTRNSKYCIYIYILCHTLFLTEILTLSDDLHHYCSGDFNRLGLEGWTRSNPLISNQPQNGPPTMQRSVSHLTIDLGNDPIVKTNKP